VALDKPALNLLPAEPFDLSQWSRARVNIDYHIVFDTSCQGRSKNRPLGRRESRPLPRKLGFCIEGFAGAAGA
jgi:hypothetical protein